MTTTTAIRNTYFVIMAGGIGSRFWPASRTALPKQFLDIMGTGRSLIQMTFDRVMPLVPLEQIIVMTNEQYSPIVREHLPQLPVENILEEPSRQNTAPCVAYVSFHIKARNPEANLVILPADHLITRESKFHSTLKIAAAYVTENADILTLGMSPHRPDTGYGYIELGKQTKTDNIFHVESFREKPKLEIAKKYLEDNKYVWNAGIFIASVKTMLDAFSDHATEIYDILSAPDHYGEPSEKKFIGEKYEQTPSISIDYAIMEKANNITCYVVDIGWSDIGTWKSLYDLRQKMDGDIVTNQPEDQMTIIHSDKLMVHTQEGKKVLIKGLSNMLIVDQPDILMIWPLDEEQEIKNVRKKLATIWNTE